MQARGLTRPPIVVSELLVTPEAQKIKDQGGMVGDKEVIGILLRKLLEPDYRDGALLDGFPRTRVQVECLKLLVDQINQLHNEFENTPLAIHFRRPIDSRHGAVRHRADQHRASTTARSKDRRAQQGGRRDRRRAGSWNCVPPI